MNIKVLQRIYASLLLVILAGIVLHAPLTVWLGSMAPDYELILKSWKEIVMLMAVSFGILIVSKKDLWEELWKDWLFRCILAYAFLHIALITVFWNGSAATLAGLAIDLRFIFYFGLVYVLIRTAPEYKKLFIKVGAIGAAVVCAFALLQVTVLPRDILSHIGYSKETIAPYLTVDNNPDYVRINSTLRGPNPLGAYMVMVVCLVLAYILRKVRTERRALSLLLGIGGLVGLWASYSRSALVAMAAGGVIIFAVASARVLSRRNWIIISAVLFAIVGSLLIGRGSEFVSQVILHEDPDGGSSVSSNDQHVASLQDGVVLMLHQPQGAGVGSTGSASLYGNSPLIIENQYLFIAHEVGWIGLALFISISIMVLTRLWQRRKDWLALGLFASGIGLALIGMLLPVWVDDTVALVWWGMAAVAIGGKHGKSKSE